MSEEIKSPPYPKDNCTLPLLLAALAELRDWLIYYREWANGIASEYSDQEIVVVPENLVEVMVQSVYVSVIAVNDIYRICCAMRSLREHWDHMLRMHEDAWDSRLAVSQRLRCIRGGYSMLADAFLTPEIREARSAAMSATSHTAMRKLMQKLGMPDNGILTETDDGDGLLFSLTPPDKLEIDFNELFHATDKLDESTGEETQEK